MATLRYKTATCAQCARPITGLEGPRVHGWNHVQKSDETIDGQHGAFPAAGTEQVIREVEV